MSKYKGLSRFDDWDKLFFALYKLLYFGYLMIVFLIAVNCIFILPLTILVEAFQTGLITEAQANQIWSTMLSKKRKLGANSSASGLVLPPFRVDILILIFFLLCAV